MRLRSRLFGFLLTSAVLAGTSLSLASAGGDGASATAPLQCDATPMLVADATGDSPSSSDAGQVLEPLKSGQYPECHPAHRG